ncbi:MAG TPA: thermonuclease family protein [Aggregatilineales bacterium]|nr:thermonuclease family protein [Anaerolineales bacterium]HRE47278.1 thermonuclease family protein [Aggregatilineales bacterium]
MSPLRDFFRSLFVRAGKNLFKRRRTPSWTPPHREAPQGTSTPNTNNSEPPRKNVETRLGGIIILLLIGVLAGCTSATPTSPTPHAPSPTSPLSAANTATNVPATRIVALPPSWTPTYTATRRPAQPTNTPRPTATQRTIPPTNTVSPRAEAATPADTTINYPTMPAKTKLVKGTLVRVVDGDTMVITLNGRDERVRVLGINTPESVAENRPVECFGKEAANRAKELLPARLTVYLETDPKADTVDQYGRLLRFIWLEDGSLFNLQMIAEGYAYEYTYDRSNPYQYQAQFKAAQRTAQRDDLGLWSPQTCNGQR